MQDPAKLKQGCSFGRREESRGCFGVQILPTSKRERLTPRDKRRPSAFRKSLGNSIEGRVCSLTCTNARIPRPVALSRALEKCWLQ